MSKVIIATTGLLYFAVCLEQTFKGNYPMALTYFGYAFSNIGLYILAS